MNIIINAFKLKDSIYLIIINGTKEERNAFQTLLKKKKEVEQKYISGEWVCIIKGPPWA